MCWFESSHHHPIPKQVINHNPTLEARKAMRTAAISTISCLLGLSVGFGLPVGTGGAVIYVALVLGAISAACGAAIEGD